MTEIAGQLRDCTEEMWRVVGSEHVRPALREEVIDGIMPQFVVEPGSPEELAQVLSIANNRGVRIIARGSGTKLDWGNVPRAVEILLSTRRLDRILEHAAGDMTATVQAGCGVAAFGRLLAQRGQRLALDPLWPDRATIGGILATHDSGALRATFGSLRDHLIGVTIALADGTLARSGGKVVKNVAGYDLPKLIIGSFGTLGVITEATFRLYPVAQATRTLVFAVPTHEILLRALGAPGECSSVTTAVQIEMETNAVARILVLVEGFPGALEGKVSRVMQAVTGCGAVPDDLAADAWESRERLFSFADGCVCKVSLLRAQWPDFMEALRGVAHGGGIRWKLVAQAFGLGLICLHGAALPQMADAVKSLRGRLESFGGSLVVLRCATEMKGLVEVWPDAGDALPVIRRVKEQFDLKGILSPGRFVGGI